MANKKELQSIYKKTADIANDIINAYEINRVYDVFCNTLLISRYINIDNLICSDIDNIKIDIMNAYINDDISKIKSISSNIMNRSIANIIDNSDNTEMEHLLEILSTIYSQLSTNEFDFKSLDDILKYNSSIHTERFSKNELIHKLNSESIKINCNSFNKIDILCNSLVLCYAPFRKTDITKDKFNHKGYFEWLANLSKRENIYLLVLSYENPGEAFTMIDDFGQETKKKLNLYVSNNIEFGLADCNEF